jgi:adenosylcobinamide-GDP ribazoletransferase
MARDGRHPAAVAVNSLRLALAMFTVLPVPRGWHGTDPVRPEAAARTVRWLPVVGAALGGAAGLAAAAVLDRDRGAVLLAASVGVGALAVLSRGLHLDGLADTADGLASRAPADRALEIMRRSDIGPFGVISIVLVLAVEIAALSTVARWGVWSAAAALAVAAATGRLAVVHAALPGVPAARTGGFGALVAGGTACWVAAVLTVVVLGGGVALAAAVDADPIGWPVAQAAALVLAAGLRVHTTRRLGGVTGDVFGALIEVATAATLVGLALAP